MNQTTWCIKTNPPKKNISKKVRFWYWFIQWKRWLCVNARRMHMNACALSVNLGPQCLFPTLLFCLSLFYHFSSHIERSIAIDLLGTPVLACVEVRVPVYEVPYGYSSDLQRLQYCQKWYSCWHSCLKARTSSLPELVTFLGGACMLIKWKECKKKQE